MIPRELANRFLADILTAARLRGIRIRVAHLGLTREVLGWVVFLDETEEEYHNHNVAVPFSGESAGGL